MRNYCKGTIVNITGMSMTLISDYQIWLYMTQCIKQNIFMWKDIEISASIVQIHAITR